MASDYALFFSKSLGQFIFSRKHFDKMALIEMQVLVLDSF